MTGPHATAAPRLSTNLQGIFWLMLSLPCFQVMNVMLRHVAGDLPPVEVMFFRNLFGFLVLLPWLLRGGRRTLRTRQLPANLLRALCHVSGMVLWVYALTLVPLAAANALMATSPLFVAVAAVVLLREPSRWQRWLAVLVGFAGALLIIRPGFVPLSPGVLVVLAAAALLGASKMLTKVITRTDSTLSAVFYLNLLMSLIALVPTVLLWRTPSLAHFGWFVALAAVGALAHLTMTKAITCADLTTLQPFEFFALIWAAAFGFVLFAEVPEAWVLIGGGVIILGATGLARLEAPARPAPRR